MPSPERVPQPASKEMKTPEISEDLPETLPPLMKERHTVLRKIHSLLLEKGDPKELFNFDKTTHADLELFWIRKEFQQNEIGISPEDCQIVIAKVLPEQKSKPHLHEIGSSSGVVLGDRVGLNNPGDLIYRAGEVDFQTGQAIVKKEVACIAGTEFDIPAYQVHQFENKDSEPAYLLLVTRPTIGVKEGEEDIHFVFTNQGA